jgi:hypothetical protein
MDVKLLHPKADTKYTGPEPQWKLQPTENRNEHIISAFTWYNYHYSNKEAKEFVISYLDRHDRKEESRKIKTLSDSQINLQMGWLARMSLVGLELDANEQHHINKCVNELMATVQVKQEEKPDVPRVNIQDRLREKAVECAGELEGMYDEYILAVNPKLADFKPLSTIRGMNIQPQYVNYIRDIWTDKQTEITAALDGTDEQLAEAYSCYNRNQLKSMLKFVEQVVADCGSYTQLKKVERKPRAKKKQAPEFVARKIKYLREFPELKLTSESPAKLVDCSEAYVYDTKKRKLQHYVADAHAVTFTVKNNSLIGFDSTNSVQKTLRKPEVQLKELLANGKPGARKYFKDIRATEIKLNGRFNENLVILKAW